MTCLRPSLVWHVGETDPHVVKAPAVDAEGQVIPEDWDRYIAEKQALADCPNARSAP